MWLLNSKIHFLSIRKNPHSRILKGKPKEQHLSTIPKSCSFYKDTSPCLKENTRNVNMMKERTYIHIDYVNWSSLRNKQEAGLFGSCFWISRNLVLSNIICTLINLVKRHVVSLQFLELHFYFLFYSFFSFFLKEKIYYSTVLVKRIQQKIK